MLGRNCWWLLVLGLLLLGACGEGEQQPEAGNGLAGWETGGAYDQNYDPLELDRIKGYYQEVIEFTPMEGMAPGIGIVMRDRADDQMVKVHLGPKAFLANDLGAFGLRVGQKVKVTGVWAEFAGEDVLIASKIKKGEYDQLKVRRTKDGLAYWAMSPELLKAERAAEFEGAN